MLARFIALVALLLAVVNAFQPAIRPSLTSARQPLRMAWAAKETNEHFLIAPSILSADFARLGEEVQDKFSIRK